MMASGFGRLTDRPVTFLLVGPRVVDPASGADETRDVGVVAGVIADRAAVPAGAPRLDGRGLVVAPGLCDLHAHLRDPGDPAAETLDSGARAAAKGGFTTVCAMPNTDPPVDWPALVTDLAERGRAAACRVRVVAAATRGRAGQALANLPALAEAGAVAFSDDGASVPSERLVRDLLGALAALDLPFFEHAEDPALATGAVMRAGPTALRLGLAGWPPAAELSVVERDLRLADATGARIHFTHLSTATAVEAIGAARVRGVSVTCDVTPHHLALTDAWVAGHRRFAWENAPKPLDGSLDPVRAFDGACRVNPPLTTRDDALMLLAAVADGTVDAVATDHAPHPAHAKLVPFDQAAPGLLGLETALSVGLAAVEAGRLSLTSLLAALSTRPAAIIGEARGLTPGRPADLVLFDPAARWQVEPAALASASANTPLLGMELPGVVRLTVAGGRVTYRA